MSTSKIERERVIFTGIGGVQVFIDEKRTICTSHSCRSHETEVIPFEWQRTSAEITTSFHNDTGHYEVGYKLDSSDEKSKAHHILYVSSKTEAIAASEAIRKAIAIHVEATENEPHPDVDDTFEAVRKAIATHYEATENVPHPDVDDTFEAVRKAIATHYEAIVNEPHPDVDDNTDIDETSEDKCSQTTSVPKRRKRCNTCDTPMFYKNRFADGRTEADAYREEWMCYECDKKLAKTFLTIAAQP